MAAAKPEEIVHPPMDQLQGLEYCIDSNPSWGTLHFQTLIKPKLSFHFILTSFDELFFIDQFSLLWHVETGEAIALGFQHYILALGTAVMIPSFLVPLMGGSNVSFPLKIELL